VTAGELTAWTAAARARARSSTLLPHLAMLATMVIWSGNAVSVKVGLEHVQAIPFTAARFAIGAAVLAGYTQITRQQLRRRPPLKLLIPAAITGVVINQLGFTYGVHLSTAVDISIIMGLGPLATALGLMLILRRRPPARRLAGLAIGFAGVVAVVGASARGGGGSLLGDLIGLASPLSWAAYTLIASEAARRSSASVFLTWTILFSLVLLVPIAGFQALQGGEQWIPALPSLLYSSVLATGAGYLFFFWAIPRLGVTETAVYSYLQPLLGALMGAFFLGEEFGLLQAGGAIAIVAGAYLGSWSRTRTSGAARGGRGG
jgi:O-acetylserine/cysteine efflux transporter